jgi:anaerobic magnesium-protoporphyrin IX monomethyl ester cyclase
MGVESTDDEVLRQIQKGSTTRQDFDACRLLKQHGIFSIIGHIVGFGSEDHASFRTAQRQLRLYEGDYLNAMYVTPHAWTPFGEEVRRRRVVEPDQAKWDYRHQVLAQDKLRPWQLFLAVKWLELRFHLRPARLLAILREPDRLRRRQQFWVFRQVALVWLAEVFEFLVRALRWPAQ